MTARALFAAAALVACGGVPGAKETTPRVIVETQTGAHAVTVELARTDEERARGLMNRRALAPDSGMLFVFETSDDHSFWMKNTLIPLDMIFISEEGRVAGVVANATPLTLSPRTIGKPSRYVLEVNGGWAASHAVKPGDRVRFEHVL